MTTAYALSLIQHKLQGDRDMPNADTLSHLFFEALCDVARLCVPDALVVPLEEAEEFSGQVFRRTVEEVIIRMPTYPTPQEIQEAMADATEEETGDPDPDPDPDPAGDPDPTEGEAQGEGILAIDEELAMAVVYLVCSLIAEDTIRYRARAEMIIAAYQTNR